MRRTRRIWDATCPFQAGTGHCGLPVSEFLDTSKTHVICPKGHTSPRSTVRGLAESGRVVRAAEAPPRFRRVDLVAAAAILALAIDAVLGHLL